MERFQKASFYKYDKFYTIYRGIDLLTEQPVWIKVINKEFYFTRNFSYRFDLWSRLLSSLDHPNIVKYISFEKNINEYLIITEYFEPQPLSEILRVRSLSYQEITTIYKQTLDAYSFLHSKKIINIDIDLRKIHFFSNQKVKIEDFGLINLLFDKIFRYKEFYLNDFNFISPEFIKDLPLDHRNDIYSLGVLLYTLVEGIKPFPKNLNKNQIAQKILTENIPLPKRTEQFNQIILKATHKDPEQRYQSVEKLKHDFNTISLPQTQNKSEFKAKPYNTLTIKPTQQGTKTSQKLQQEQAAAHHRKKSRKSYKPGKSKFFSILQIIAILAFAIIDIFLLWLILNNLNKPSDYQNYLIYNKPEKLKIFNWSNNTFITALCDTGIYNLVLDVNDTILHDTYVSLDDIDIKNITFNNGILYYVGRKNSSTPALLLVYKTYYEPYFDTKFSGQYSSVAVANNLIYLLKTNQLDTSILEIRYFDMSLYKNIKLPKPVENQLYLKILPLSTNKISILSAKISPTYFTMKDVIHAPDTFYLQTFDTTGNKLWQSTFTTQSLPYVNSEPKAVIITSLTDNKHLTIRKFNFYGKLIDSIKITLPYTTNQLTSAISDTNTITLLLKSKTNNYILKTTLDGKILYKTKLENVRKLHYTDLTKIANDQIMVIGYFKNNLLSKINGIDLYLIHTVKINSQNGKYKHMTLKQAVMSYINQNYENPFSKK